MSLWANNPTVNVKCEPDSKAQWSWLNFLLACPWWWAFCGYDGQGVALLAFTVCFSEIWPRLVGSVSNYWFRQLRVVDGDCFHWFFGVEVYGCVCFNCTVYLVRMKASLRFLGFFASACLVSKHVLLVT